MSLKLKFMRKVAPLPATSQNNIEKANWIEVLRRLREALDQMFRVLSSCIEKDVDRILASSFTDENAKQIEWSVICAKYANISQSCSGILTDLRSEDSFSQKLLANLQDTVIFFTSILAGLGKHSFLYAMDEEDAHAAAGVAAAAFLLLSAGYLLQKRERRERRWWTVSLHESRSRSNTDVVDERSIAASERSHRKSVNDEKEDDRSFEFSDSASAAPSMSTITNKKSNNSRRKSHNNIRDIKENNIKELEFRDQPKIEECNALPANRPNSKLTIQNSSEKLSRNPSQASVVATEPFGSKSGQSQLEPLLIFDCRGNPLTDHNGVPLINMHRKLVIKFNDNKPISHVNGEPIFDEFGLPFVGSLDEPLKNAEGRPLRLFNQENIPLTDSNGVVLKLNNGNHAVVLDEHNRILGDSFGSPIYNENGKPLNGNMSKRNQQAAPFQCMEGHCCLLFNSKGFLLTDASGKPLTTSSGQPLIKYGPNGEVNDLFGGPVYDEKGDLYGNKAPIPYLCLYDSEGFPLANSKGDVLQDANGRPLVVFDPSGRPVSDSNNRVVYDSAGNPCNVPSFQAYTERAVTPKKPIFDFEIQLFNGKGRPMMDYDGSALADTDGRSLIVMNGGKPLHDLEGNSLYDDMGIPITQVNGAWTCPQGSPYRAFDCQGRPLTDKRGKDLYNINRQSLLRLDKAGRPVFTYTKGHVCDRNGHPVFDTSFDPSVPPPNDELRMQVFVNDSPLKVFDRSGKPLSDQDGMAMVDAQGRCLIQFNEAGIPIGDITGATIYDENRLPLGCSQNSPIVSMNGLPFRLFNVQKRPLTDKNGVPLSLANEKPLIKFDGVGRPTADVTGGPVLDFRGRNVSSDPEARADSVLPEVDHVVKDNQGNPLQLFDASGWPLTDVLGLVLVNADGTHLRLSHNGEPVADSQGGPLFDQYGTPLEEVLLTAEAPKGPENSAGTDVDSIDERDAFGRFMKDSIGAAQFDTYGRPLYDLYRRQMFDHTGRPVADVAGRRIFDGRREPTFKLPFDVRILSSGFNRSCLKKFSAGHYKDLLGGPLFDSDGIPLFNEHGKPLVDMYGRDLYDSQGQLQCDSKGKPLSKQLTIYLNGRDIADVRDIVKMIRVPKEMVPSMSSCLIAGKRVADSVILPGSCIVGSYPKPSPSRPGKMYWGLLRITELSDGSLIHEILKAMELDDGIDLGTGDHNRQTSATDHQKNEQSSNCNHSEQSFV